MGESGYFAVIPGWLLSQPGVSDGAKLFFCEVSRRCNERGYCWSSNEALANELGCGERTISRYVAELEGCGAISTEISGVSERKRRYERRIRLSDGGLKIAKNGDLKVAKNGEFKVAKNGELTQGNKLNNNYNPPRTPPEGGRRTAEPAKWLPERFEKFWKFYRENINPANRTAARKAWDKLKPDDALIAEIAVALTHRLKSDDEWKRGIGRPHASTYLNGMMWLDDAVQRRRDEAGVEDKPKGKRFVRTDVIDGQEVDVYE